MNVTQKRIGCGTIGNMNDLFLRVIENIRESRIIIHSEIIGDKGIVVQLLGIDHGAGG